MNLIQKHPYLQNKNYWIFSAYFFFYFFIMSSYFPFFPVWLKMLGLTQAQTGFTFSCISFSALCFQPILGVVSDKLGMKKHLVWIITGLLVLFGPFFIFILGPLLTTNTVLGSIVGGLYLGFVFNGGSHVIEAYVEKVSRWSDFEFGRARMFGCFGWAICASFVGIMITKNINFVFWLASGFAIVLLILVKFVNPSKSSSLDVADKVLNLHKEPAFKLKLVFELLKMPKIWFFMLYIVGVACTYDVFDQQFANFFTSFFSSPERGREIFGFVTTFGEILNATVMFFAPVIVAKVGSKNTLLIAGLIMTIRITGSAFATSPVEVVILKTLHMFEAPLLLVGAFKYITRHFPVKFSATVFLVGFCFAKQLAIMFMSTLAGKMYESIDFHGTYLVLGAIVFTFTLISSFTLSGRGPIDLILRRTPNTTENMQEMVHIRDQSIHKE